MTQISLYEVHLLLGLPDVFGMKTCSMRCYHAVYHRQGGYDHRRTRIMRKRFVPVVGRVACLRMHSTRRHAPTMYRRDDTAVEFVSRAIGTTHEAHRQESGNLEVLSSS